jgi:hypothetical protein
MNAAAEMEILLLAARVDCTEAQRERLRLVVPRVTDWHAVILAAFGHGTAALLCHALLTNAPDLLSSELRLAAGGFLDSHRQAAHAATGDLVRILDALAGAGIAAIPFKGPAIALQAYGDPGLRSFRDLDVLIGEQDVAPTMRVLAGLGYRSQADGLNARQMQRYYRYNGQDILFADGRLPVEPHWAFAPRTFSACFDPTGVWQRAVPCALDGRSVRLLSPEDTLIVASLHGCKERWSRLLWIADIAMHLERCPELDWDAVLARAGRAGLLRMVLLGVALAERLAGAPVPERVRRRIGRDRICQTLAAGVIARLFAESPAQASVFALSGFHWQVRERLVDRLRYVVLTLTTARRQHLRMLDPPAPFACAYPVVKLLHDYLALPLWQASKAFRQRAPRRNPG